MFSYANRQRLRVESLLEDLNQSSSLFEFDRPPTEPHHSPVMPHRPTRPAPHPVSTPAPTPPKQKTPYHLLSVGAKKVVQTGAREGRERAGFAATTGASPTGSLGHVLRGMVHSVLKRPAPVGPRSVGPKDPRRTPKFESHRDDDGRFERVQMILRTLNLTCEGR